MKEMYIICKNSDTKGIITFYAENKEESYFLFQQKFRRSSYEFYKKGIRMTQAFSYKRTHRDKAIQNVIRRLPAQIAYEVLRKYKNPICLAFFGNIYLRSQIAVFLDSSKRRIGFLPACLFRPDFLLAVLRVQPRKSTFRGNTVVLSIENCPAFSQNVIQRTIIDKPSCLYAPSPDSLFSCPDVKKYRRSRTF